MNRFSTDRYLAVTKENERMARVFCDICGLWFNDEQSCSAHHRVCSEEVFDQMLGEVGKWFRSECHDGKVIGRIVGVRSCFEYDVRAVTVKEDDNGELTIRIPAGLSSVDRFEELDREAVENELRRMTSTVYEHVLQDVD